MDEQIAITVLIGLFYMVLSWFCTMEILWKMWYDPKSIYYGAFGEPNPNDNDELVFSFVIVYLLWIPFTLVAIVRMFLQWDVKRTYRKFIGRFAHIIRVWIESIDSVRQHTR